MPRKTPDKSQDGQHGKQSAGSSTAKDYTEENEYLRGRLEEQLKTITMLRQKEVDQKLVSMSKDEFKRKNNELIEENGRLQRENAQLTAQSNQMFAAEIAAKNISIQELDKKSALLIAGYDDIQKKFSEIESSVSRKDFNFVAEIAKQNEKQKEIQAKIDKISDQLMCLRSRTAKTNSMANYVNNCILERHKMLEFIMDRGKDIQEQQRKNFALTKELERLQMLVRKLQDDIAKMKDQS